MDSGQRGRTPNVHDWADEDGQMMNEALRAGSVEERRMAEALSGFTGEVGTVNNSGVTNVRAQALGRGALFSGNEAGVLMSGDGKTPEEVAFEHVENTGKASVETAVGLSEAMNRVTNPETSVGVLSDVEVKEFERRDIETDENEAEPKRSFVAKTEYKNQEAVAKDVAPEVDNKLHEKRYELIELLKLYRDGRERTLKTVGHPIGEDN